MAMNMNMNMKRRMKMRGFMCQTPGATAVCMAGGGGDPRSLIVPRRPDRTLVDRATVINNTAKYSRLVESRRAFGSANKRSAATTTTTTTMPLPSIKRHQGRTGRDRKALQKPPSVTSSSDQVFQVVVMRVSLHCQGCAGKVKKHLSKMEGVTSFSIDLENKRVTVMGHVSPVGVLESISKVKRAEFWPC